MTDEQKPPEDFAAILQKHFQTVQNTAGGKPRYRMSDRNKRKLEKIRERVKELRGQG